MLFAGFATAIPVSIVLRGISFVAARDSEDEAALRARQWRRRARIAEATTGGLLILVGFLFAYLSGGFS